MRYDAIILGGSFAGLSAALYLGRARRTVCVIDAGKPRNRFTDVSHGQFAHDGSDPAVMLQTMRAQVAAYPTVEFIDQPAIDALRGAEGFRVILKTGDILAGSRLLLAHGITDLLPNIPGLSERWGRSVIHCPYCHGYEFRDKQLGVLNISDMSVHQASLISEWGPTTFLLNGDTIEPELQTELARRGVMVEAERVETIVGEGKHLSAVRLADGRELPLDALYISPPYQFSSDIAERLGCAIEPGALGPMIIVDEMKATDVAGVFAAGDITRSGHTVTFACADGVMAALAIHRSLVFDKES